jgi:site-specific DNA-methyltransferase (adenine-specific)
MSIADVLEGRARFVVEQGDGLDVLRTMPDASVDALVTDPPAGIAFMNKKWDHDRGGRDQWVAWLEERMREAYRVMKPGAHGLVWALPRTSHWTAYALENAGFEIADRKSHVFGSGFPKSVNPISAQIQAGRPYPNIDPEAYALIDWMKEHRAGYGTALKPAVEDWWLIRKPREGTIVETVREHGTGAMNIDACRVEHASAADFAAHAAGVNAIKARGGSMDNSWKNSSDLSGASDVTEAGRWPSHLLLSHSENCQRVGNKKVKAAPAWNDNRPPSLFTGKETSPVHHADADGTETVADWECVENCPVRLLDEQSGVTRNGGQNATSDRSSSMHDGGLGPNREPTQFAGDEGGASRYFTTFPPFFYTAKADRADRERGCEHLPVKSGGELTGRTDGTDGLNSPRAGAGRKGGRRNTHPTVKSTDLMRWLCKLITPPGGVVLDMFAGSGSTGVACSAEGFRFIGIELDPDSVVIAKARIVGDQPLFNTLELCEENP